MSAGSRPAVSEADVESSENGPRGHRLWRSLAEAAVGAAEYFLTPLCDLLAGAAKRSLARSSAQRITGSRRGYTWRPSDNDAV